MSPANEQRLKSLVFLKKFAYGNLMKNYLPFPMDTKLCSGWAKGIPTEGPTVIYTSMMYQMAPLFKNYEKMLPTISKMKGISQLAGIGKYFYRPSKTEVERAYRILNNIAAMLSNSGVQFAYLYDREPYSGALLLELGMIDEFREYGKRLLEFFGSRGITRLITVDPHTTNALSRLREYHKSDIEVIPYLFLLKGARAEGEFVLHDSCLYSKHLKMYESIRQFMRDSGLKLKEDRMVTGRETAMCCGSPVGVVNPELSEEIAAHRAGKLSSVGSRVILMCPMCYQNLSPHIRDISDLAEVIH
ncbi:MAG: (Fe-S)-binding protein [Thermoplasmata archaeon]|nr:(Fe-S)-binding protein [Candidatus Sysuiplasma acidicola]